MPANIILFQNYPSLATKPPRLYCDANFLIRLLYYHDNAATPAILKPEDIKCYQFYEQLKQNNADLVTSVYGFSELIHFYFFWYGNNGMYRVVQNFLRQNSITGRGPIHEQYKYFIRRFPTDFISAFNRISHRIDKAETFLSQIGVRILYPLPSPQLTNISKSIVEYASILLDAFPKLESNDAMHLSIADYLSVPYIISLDEAYKDVDGLTLLTLN